MMQAVVPLNGASQQMLHNDIGRQTKYVNQKSENLTGSKKLSCDYSA